MRTEAPSPAPAAPARAPRALSLGSLAGLIGIGCCIYPVVLVLFGLASATEAIALGNTLFGTWGWAFKLAGGGFALAGVVVHLRRRGECSLEGARRNRGFMLRVALMGLVVYWVVYGITKALAAWGS